MADERFKLQAHLEKLYYQAPRRMAFRARSVEEFEAWKGQFRAELEKLLALAGRRRPPASAEKLQARDRGRYVQEKYALDVSEAVKAPIYVLVPKAKPPFKPVLAFHGHNPSVQYILGNYPDEKTAAEQIAKDNNYAQVLAESGYLVCAVEQRGFGERLSTCFQEGWSCSDRHLAFSYMMQGRCLIGERCWDGMCAIDYLLSRDDVAGQAVAATGNSGGGTTTLWLSALDDRITVSIPSCYFCSFKASIIDLRHCECNYVPGILNLSEMGDLAALIAPRPFRVIAGEQDDIFPIAAVREQFETVRRAYALLGAEEKCSLAVHPGPHSYNHAMCHEWLAKWL
ncbi:MAG: alpha/beta hydrolase family protein [Planctomycetota bacterium]